MKAVVVIVVLAVALLALWVIVRGRARNLVAPQGSVDALQELRRKMLTLSPQEFGIRPSEDFPRVYGILMDFAVGEHTATVFAASNGAASLYTTSTFGVLGGEAHESVRLAARRFVSAAGRHYDAAAPTTEYPHPAPDQVFFYLLTFEGVRVIATDLESASLGAGEYAELYRLGQQVLGELRLVSGG